MACPVRDIVAAALVAATSCVVVVAAAPQTIIMGPNLGVAPPTETSGDGIILGRVVDGTSGTPVPGALVALGGFPPPTSVPAGVTLGLGPTGQPLALTDGDGRFVFRDLAEGRFTVMVQAPGYLPGAAGSRRPQGAPGTITLGRGESRTDVEVPVWKAGSISGIVLDELGEPVVEVPLRLLRRSMVRGRPGFTVMGTATTDDRGQYRVGSLAPGDYVVFVPSTLTTMPVDVADAYLSAMDSGDPNSRQLAGQVTSGGTTAAAGGITVGNQRVATDYGRALTPAPGVGERFAVYPAAFHPASPSPQGATVVTVGSGEERAGIDIRTSLVASYSLSGVVTGPAGPVPNTTVRLVPTYVSQLSSDTGFFSVTTSTDGQGRFTLIGATPGDYYLRASRAPSQVSSSIVRAGDGTFMMMDGAGGAGAAADPTVLTGEAVVSILDRDLSGVSLPLTGGLTVSGRAEFVGRAKPPTATDLARGSIQLVRADGQTLAPVQPGRFEANGTFTTRQYPAGSYTLNAGAVTAGWYLRSIRVGGREVIDRVIDLTADLSDVVVTFGDTMGEVIGSARPSGSPAERVDGSVALFPADYRAWIAGGMSSRRARRADVSSTGRFEFHTLLPGEYLAAAVTADSDFDLQNPADIEALARLATPVTVTDTQGASLSLTITRLR